MEDSGKRGRGRPKGATGHAKTSRSLRVGPVWDEAIAVATARGESLTEVVEAALRRYVQRHRES